MEISRVRDCDRHHLKNDESYIKSTGLIAKEEEDIIGILEYNVINIEEIGITNFNTSNSNEGYLLLNFINEIVYWHPYIKRIIIHKDQDYITSRTVDTFDDLKSEGDRWVYYTEKPLDIVRLNINDVRIEQLTVDQSKLSRVSSWITKPEDIIINCVKIDDKIVCIDGYSRLVTAYNKGFQNVYAFIASVEDDSFYRTCMRWCDEEGVHSIKDLAKRVVSPEEHERIWIDRCQNYLKNRKTI